VAQLYPRALGSLLSPLTTRRDYGGGILTRLHTGNWVTVVGVQLDLSKETLMKGTYV
jgi:hypothetical protein